MDFSVDMQMNGARTGRLAGLLTLLLICLSCGDTYRPVAIPITPPPPDPSSFHFVLIISGNGASDPGASSRIDVSGDTNVSVTRVGVGPVHVAMTPGGGRVYVANSLEDTISTYTPTNFTAVTTVSLPPGSFPVFLATTQTDAVYAANFGNGTVAAIATLSNVATDIIRVDNTQPIPDPNSKPVALVETPDSKKVYVVNQGTGSVTSINTIDKSVNNNGQPIPTGTMPVWAVARSDSQRVYVLNSGSGTVTTIDTFSDTVVPGGTASVGAGANYMVYDRGLNRLYVTNPTTNTLSALDVSNDSLNLLFSAPVPAGAISVAALPEGTRVYVASVVVSGGNATSQVTILNASDGSVRKTIALTTVPAICNLANTRFELFTAASADSSRVYVGNCDAGNTAIIRTTPNDSPGDPQPPDTLVLNMPAPVSAAPPPGPGEQPPPQNPVFILAGP
jgi:DNA-binding beta-propeller fold protein YncE